MSRRVAVTGIGLVTPLGVGTDETWDALVEGRTAVGPLENFDPSSLRTQVGAEVREFEPKQFVENRRTLRMMTRADKFAIAGAVLAVRDSGIEIREEDAERCALFVGSNKELCDPLHLVGPVLAARNEDGTANMRLLGEQATSLFYPLFYVEGLQAASLFYISEAFGLKGANTYFAGTAETGAVAIGRAYRAIRRGEADMAIAGGFDDPVTWYTMTKFDALGILTGSNELGPAACRPYDVDRDGTVFGEGSAFFVLEELESAQARGARIYGEIAGFGSGYDIEALLKPQAEGRALQLAVQSALREAEATPDEIGYVAADGSGTQLGDASEARALRTLFGSNGAGPAASSVKAAAGNLVAGAGSLNAAVAALALHRGVVPPTLNLDRPDPAWEDQNWVRGEAREVQTDATLAVARGLEGQNVALVMRAVR